MRVTGSTAGTSPSSMANGPTAADILPQVPLQSTKGFLTSTCAKLNVTSYAALALCPMRAALLSDEMPPPRPSIWRPSGSGLPSAVRMMLSRVTWSYGAITSSRKNTARLVPPRINTAGILCCIAFSPFDSFPSIHPELSSPMPNIARPRPDQSVVGVLLQHMRRPADDTRAGNHIRKYIQREAQVVQHWRRKIIHIGDDPLGLTHTLLRRRGNTEPAVVATRHSKLLGHSAQLRGAWITGTVHPVAKSR